jgi:hypothetical protein
MPRFADLPADFCCPHRQGCPYLEGLSTSWVWQRYQATAGTESQYEYQLADCAKVLAQEQQRRQQVERENQQLQAQLQALHRRQFKGRRMPAPPPPEKPADAKKRGAPVGHPPWQRAKPTRIDAVVTVPAPAACPQCQQRKLQPVAAVHEHVQEDIVLEPRTVVTCFQHQQAYCPQCAKNVWQPGPGELPGACLGPVAKATATYLRYQLNVPNRKVSQFFKDFFGLHLVPASVYGFEQQAARRGRPLYEDLRQKIRALPVVQADETSWRHDGATYWVWYAGDADLAFFHLDAHRSSEAAQQVLGERFPGTLVADAYAAYNGVQPKDRQSCLAHIKTKAKELAQELALLTGPAADPQALKFCQKIQGFVHEACQAHRDLVRLPWRAGRAKKQHDRLRRRLQALCRRRLRYAKAEAFRKRLQGPAQKNLLTCFRRPNVPPTNNQAERSLRPVVIMRKVVQGTRGEQGLENHSVLRSLFETARRQGKEPLRFFQALFTKDTEQAQAELYRHPLPKKPSPPRRC